MAGSTVCSAASVSFIGDPVVRVFMGRSPWLIGVAGGSVGTWPAVGCGAPGVAGSAPGIGGEAPPVGGEAPAGGEVGRELPAVACEPLDGGGGLADGGGGLPVIDAEPPGAEDESPAYGAAPPGGCG